MQENEEQILQELPDQKIKKPDVRIFTLIFIFVLLLIGIFSFFQKKSANQNTTSVTKTEQFTVTKFFHYSIPKPIDKLTTFDFPNDGSIDSPIKIGDHIWFAGAGSIIEYDTKSSSIISYTDAKKANCFYGLVYINKFLYAVCSIDNIDDAFGTTRKLETRLFTGHKGVLKIDPVKHTVVHVFTKSDGLLNGYNYELVPDGDYLWIPTFNGLGRINTLTDKVDFYTAEMGFRESSGAKTFSIQPIIVDKDYVWAWNIASVETQGGIAVFDKRTQKWHAFGPRDLKDYYLERIDLEYNSEGSTIKMVPGGIQIGFRDGKIGEGDRFVEKQYHYATGKWEKVNKERAITGNNNEYDIFGVYVESEYPHPPTFTVMPDQSGFVQLKLSDDPRIYQINGRDYGAISRLIGKKRYILTSSTIDVIDDSLPFSKIVVPLGERISATNEYLTHFFIDNDNTTAVVVYTGCDGIACEGQKAWLINLEQGKIVKIFTTDDGLPSGEEEYLNNLSMNREGNLLVMKNKKEKTVFSIDTAANTLVLPKK